MSGYTIRTLRPEDAVALLTFEQDNRAWFERHVEPRGDDFYTPEGVRHHISQYLDAHERGTWHPCLILDHDGRPIGRANLKEIERDIGSAEVGYRIAQAQAGKGLATAALRHLVELARTQWQLRRLHAHVASRNQASARVLERCGFTPVAGAESLATIDGGAVGVQQFSLDL